MTTKKWIFAASLVAVIGLGGCVENSLLESPGDASFGEANRQTMMAQVVNPEPDYDTEMQSNGQRSAAALERYRTGQVKQPDTIRTTNVGSDTESGSGPQ